MTTRHWMHTVNNFKGGRSLCSTPVSSLGKLCKASFTSLGHSTKCQFQRSHPVVGHTQSGEALSNKEMLNAYNASIFVCAKTGDMKRMENIICEIGSAGLVPNLDTYKATIFVYSNQKQGDKCLEALQSCKDAGFTPSAALYRGVFGAFQGVYTEGRNQGEVCLRLLREVQSSGIQVSERMYHVTFRNCEQDKRLSICRQLLAEMEHAGFTPNRRQYATLIPWLTDHGKWRDSLELLKRSQSLNHQPTGYLYYVVLRVCASAGQLSACLDVLRMMSTSCGAGTALEGGIEDHSKQGYIRGVHSARKFDARTSAQLKQLVPNVQAFNVVLHACSKDRRLAIDYWKVIEEMQRNSCRPDVTTFTEIGKIQLLLGGVTAMMEVFNDMRVSGVKPDRRLFHTLLDSACREGEWQAVDQIMREMTRSKLQPDLKCYNMLLEGLFSGGLSDMAVTVLQQLREVGLEPDDVTYRSTLNNFRTYGMKTEFIDLWREAMGSVRRPPRLQPDLYASAVMLFLKEGDVEPAVAAMLHLCKAGAAKWEQFGPLFAALEVSERWNDILNLIAASLSSPNTCLDHSSVFRVGLVASRKLHDWSLAPYLLERLLVLGATPDLEDCHAVLALLRKAGRFDEMLSLSSLIRGVAVAQDLVSPIDDSGDSQLRLISGLLPTTGPPDTPYTLPPPFVLNIDTYNLMLLPTVRLGRYDLARKVWADMKRDRVSPDSVSFKHFMEACVHAGEYKAALVTLQDVRKTVSLVPVGDRQQFGHLYVIAVKAIGGLLQERGRICDFGRSRRAESVHDITELASSSEYPETDADTLMHILETCLPDVGKHCGVGNKVLGPVSSSMLALHQQLRQLNMDSDDVRFCTAAVNVCAQSRERKSLRYLVNELLLYRDMTLAPLDPLAFSIGITAAAQAGELEVALALFDGMCEAGLNPHAHVLAVVMQCCTAAGMWEEALELFFGRVRHLETTRTVCDITGGSRLSAPLDIVVYNAALNAAAEGRRADVALRLLDEMQQAKAEVREGDPEKQFDEGSQKCFIHCIKDMIRAGPDIVSYGTVLKACVRGGQVDRAVNLLEDMMRLSNRGAGGGEPSFECAGEFGEEVVNGRREAAMPKPDEMCFLTVIAELRRDGGRSEDILRLEEWWGKEQS